MNINYEKKIKKEEKKIADYNAKIKNIYDKYETEIFSDDELQNADLIMVQYYREVIEGCNARIDEYQEKAAAQVRGGLEISNKSNKKKALICLASIGVASLLVFSACNTFNNNDGKDNQNDDSYQDEDEIKDTKDPLEDEGLTFGDDSDIKDTKNPLEDEGLTFGDDSEPEESKNDLESKENDESNKVESLYATVFTDINDEEQVYERAKYIKENYYDLYTPYLYITVEDVEEQIRHFGGGVVKNVGFDAATTVTDQVNDLMFMEKGNAVDLLNDVTTSRTESEVFIDYGIFFCDGTRAQRLASEISNIRINIMKNAKNGDVTKYREEFAELMMRSWVLQGYQAIDASALECSGSEMFIDLLFQNSASLCGDSDALIIEDPLEMEPVSFTEILIRADYVNCEAAVVSEDGSLSEETMIVNKSTSDFWGMVSEAYERKTSNNSYGLIK